MQNDIYKTDQIQNKTEGIKSGQYNTYRFRKKLDRYKKR